MPRSIRIFSGANLASLLRDRTGAAAVTVAISFTGIAGLAGLATEGANWYFTQRAMQGAADAAAHTAATAKSNGAASSAFTTEAKSVAANFNFSTGTGATVTINNPPGTGGHTADSNAIEVIISQPQPLMLSTLFMPSGPTIRARAVALANPTPASPPCVLALDTNVETSVSTSGNPALTFNGCSLWVNSDGTGALTLNGSATISTDAAFIHGTVSGAGLTTPTALDVHPGAVPHRDIYLDKPTMQGSAMASSLQATGSCGTGGASGQGLDKLFGNGANSVTTVTVNKPSCTVYDFGGSQDLHMTAGQTLNLCPGTYVFDSTTLKMDGQSTINAPPTGAALTTLCPGNTTGGVTIIFTNTSGGSPGIPNIGGGATVNLTAPTTGTYAGIALFEDRLACNGNGSNNNGCNLNLTGGATQNIAGAIYAPDTQVNYYGGSAAGGAQCTQLVAYKIQFQGNSQFNSSCQGTGTDQILVTDSKLVE